MTPRKYNDLRKRIRRFVKELVALPETLDYDKYHMDYLKEVAKTIEEQLTSQLDAIAKKPEDTL